MNSFNALNRTKRSWQSLISEVAGILSIVIGLTVLLGWIADITILKSLLPKFISMRINTALNFIFCGFALLLLQLKQINKFSTVVSYILCALIFILSLLTLGEYIFNIDFGIDQLILNQPDKYSSLVPGRMAPNTTICFMLLSIALFLAHGRDVKNIHIVRIISLIIGFIAFVAIVGYILDVSAYYSIFIYIPMAANTAIAFIIVAIGVYFSIQYEEYIKTRIEKLIIAGFGLGFISIQFVGVVAIKNNNKLLVTTNMVSHTHEVLQKIEETFSLVKDIEASTRGYSLTGDSIFLRPYYKSISTIPNSLTKLRQLTANNLSQQKYIDTLQSCIYEKINFVKQTIKQRQENGIKAAILLVNSKKGAILTGQIGGIIAKMENVEYKLLKIRTNEATESTNNSMTIILIYIYLQFGLSLFIYYLLSTDIVKRKRSEQEIKKLNEELDSRVQERTYELLQSNETLRDEIIEHRKTSEALKKSEERYRYNIDHMIEGYQIVGFDWRYIYVNDAFVKHSKYTREELLGHSVLELYPGIEETDVYKVYLQCFNERIPIHLENRFVFPDNSVGWFDLSFQPVPEGIVILSVDITERKLAEAEIQKINKELEQRVQERTHQLLVTNKELEAFSYSVSHDLRAPLRSIDGFSNQILKEYASMLDGKGIDYFTRIIKASQHMGHLIDDLLNLSKLTRTDMNLQEVNLSAMVESIAKEIRNSKLERDANIFIQEDISVRADKNLMQIALQNLLDNAWKYTRNQTDTKIEFGAQRKNGETVYFIRDNGVGFDMKYADKLFGAFQRLHSPREFEGTGIGLATVQRIVHRHNGIIWVESAINKGTTFYFTLNIN